MQEILVMAVTRMLTGYCVAGFTREPDPVSGLRWLRPVKEHPGAGGMRQADHFTNRRDSPKHIGNMRQSDDFRFRRQELLILGKDDLAAAVDRDGFQ